jgi:3'(2'), 5'-bisphosphate nucleotidase
MSQPLLPYAYERRVALACTIAAGQLCETVRHDQASIAFHKPDHSPVTVADYGAQALICRALCHYFPQDPVLGEEDAQMLASPAMGDCLTQVVRYVQGALSPEAPGETAHPGQGESRDPLPRWMPPWLWEEIADLGPSDRPHLPLDPQQVLQWIAHGKQGQPQGRFWTLDPIDGTKGYVRGDQYAVALALIENGQVQVAVMVAPALPRSRDPQTQGDRGVAFVAVRGQGAEAIALPSGQRSPLGVNPAAPFSQFRLIESVERDHGTPPWQRAVAQTLGLNPTPLQMDSLAKYGAIARGEADLYLRLPTGNSALRYENIWDHAAGVLVLEEAGGQVTDQTGQPLDFSQGSKLLHNRGIVASNGTLHAATLAAIRQHQDQFLL